MNALCRLSSEGGLACLPGVDAPRTVEVGVSGLIAGALSSKVLEGAGFAPTSSKERQIYSLLPLTARPPVHSFNRAFRSPTRSLGDGSGKTPRNARTYFRTRNPRAGKCFERSVFLLKTRAPLP